MMNFNDFGLLPAQDYHLTIDELKKSILVKGPNDGFPWDEE